MNFALKSIPTEQAKPATKDAKTAAYLHKSAGIQINPNFNSEKDSRKNREGEIVTDIYIYIYTNMHHLDQMYI
jgi:hypothetical protein